AAEAGVDLLPGPEPLRQVAPGDARPVAVQHRLHEQAVVLRRDPDVSQAPGQEILDPLPLVIAERVAAHRSSFLAGQPTRNRSPRRPIPQLRARPSTTVAFYGDLWLVAPARFGGHGWRASRSRTRWSCGWARCGR